MTDGGFISAIIFYINARVKGTTDKENVDSIIYLEVPHNGAGGAGNVLYPHSQLSATLMVESPIVIFSYVS
jgi:hypothetical protein